MTYSQMFRVMREAGLSPEKAAKYFGVSGMTIRRWEAKPGDAELPKHLTGTCVNAVYRMIAEERLSPASAVVNEIVSNSGAGLGDSADLVLGLPKDFLNQAAGNTDTLVLGLSQIGANPEHRRIVQKQHKKILSFLSWGESWKRCISELMVVIRSKKMTLLDKLVAYGALFYLLATFDLIPDIIPGVGYLDDFAILSLAIMYYEKRFDGLFPKAKTI